MKIKKINKKDIDSHEYLDKFKKVEKFSLLSNKKQNRKDKKISRSSSPSDKSQEETDSFIKTIGPEDIVNPYFYAKVVEVHKQYAFVSSQDLDGQINFNDIYIVTTAKKNLISQQSDRNLICVGDNVLCRLETTNLKASGYDLPQATVVNLNPRTNSFTRQDPFLSSRIHTLASNIDNIIVVSSFLAPTIRWRLIDRYLVMAEYNGMPCTIVLNKKDLLNESKKEDPSFYTDSMEKVEYYRSIGYRVLLLEATASSRKLSHDDDFKQLKDILKDKISLLSGHSGVGKSSLVNLFHPELLQAVEPNDDIFYKGRHTTTFTSFIKIDQGYLIDTPGIRSFNIPTIDSITLSACFPDIHPYSLKCSYRECGHDSEPGCMVKKMVQEGIIPQWRYQSFLSILNPSSREGRAGLKE